MTLLFACSGEHSKKIRDNDPLELRERAHRLSQKIIITDGHIDLPYRMAKKGFMSRNSVIVQNLSNYFFLKAVPALLHQNRRCV